MRLRKAEGGSAQVLEAAVDGFCGSVAGAGPVEVGQDVGGAFLEGPAKCEALAQRGRDAVADGVDQSLHRLSASGPVGFLVGGDHPLVDPPGRLDLHVVVSGEQRLEAALLAGVSRSAPVCRVRRAR